MNYCRAARFRPNETLIIHRHISIMPGLSNNSRPTHPLLENSSAAWIYKQEEYPPITKPIQNSNNKQKSISNLAAMTVDTPTGRKDLHLYHGDSESWVARASEKRTKCFETIPKAWVLTPSMIVSLQTPLEEHKNEIMALDVPRRSGILTERELQITEDYDVSTLLQKLATGAFTAAEVTLAFSKRAAIAQQMV